MSDTYRHSRFKVRRQATIPDPGLSPESLHASVVGIKELIEVLAGQRGTKLDRAVTFRDLVFLKLINAEVAESDQPHPEPHHPAIMRID